VGNDCEFKNVVMMGGDYFYSSDNEGEDAENIGHVSVGVGDRSIIENAIIDKNAKIGSEVRLSPNGVEDGWFDDDLGIYIRDEILVVVKNAIVPSGTKIGSA
jgi:glucose-1-phosphate adenylyltransferase